MNGMGGDRYLGRLVLVWICFLFFFWGVGVFLVQERKGFVVTVRTCIFDARLLRVASFGEGEDVVLIEQGVGCGKDECIF